MTEEFDRASFARRLEEAGTESHAAATFSALFEEFAARKSHIDAVHADIADLRQRSVESTQTLLNILRSEDGGLLTRQLFTNTMRKLNYRAYLENLQFMIGLAVGGLIAGLLIAIVMKLQ